MANSKEWSEYEVKLTVATRNAIERLRGQVLADLNTSEAEWDDPQKFMFNLKRAHREIVEVVDMLRLTVKGRI